MQFEYSYQAATLNQEIQLLLETINDLRNELGYVSLWLLPSQTATELLDRMKGVKSAQRQRVIQDGTKVLKEARKRLDMLRYQPVPDCTALNDAEYKAMKEALSALKEHNSRKRIETLNRYAGSARDLETCLRLPPQ